MKDVLSTYKTVKQNQNVFDSGERIVMYNSFDQ